MKHLLYFLLPIMLLLTACFKDDEMVAPHPRGDVTEVTIGMTQNYQYQVYYNLATASETGKVIKTSHDLLFDNNPEGWRVWLNSSLFARLAHTGTNDFAAVTDTMGAAWLFDKSDGHPDSNAVGVWLDTLTGRSHREVLLLDRGLDLVGRQRGLYKLVIDSVDEASYMVRFGKLTDAVSKTITINKRDAARFTSLLLDGDASTLLTEPDRDDWNLLFTQYTTLLFTDLGEAYPYLVTGVLINQEQTAVFTDSVAPFTSIDRAYAAAKPYSNRLDAIGYDWKEVQGDVTTGNVTYTVRPGITYLIGTRDGYYYKLRFTGFYSSDGEKGFPRFEFQRL